MAWLNSIRGTPPLGGCDPPRRGLLLLCARWLRHQHTFCSPSDTNTVSLTDTQSRQRHQHHLLRMRCCRGLGRSPTRYHQSCQNTHRIIHRNRSRPLCNNHLPKEVPKCKSLMWQLHSDCHAPRGLTEHHPHMCRTTITLPIIRPLSGNTRPARHHRGRSHIP